MDSFFLSLGLGILLFVNYDALKTTVGLGGAGPLVRVISRTIWNTALLLHRSRLGCTAFLRAAGTVIALVSIAVWVVGIALGYGLILASDPGGIVNGITRNVADPFERMYFLGFSLTTLGIGDFVPITKLSKIVTLAASLNGLFLVTLSITYLIPVVSAVLSKRQLASAISNLGNSAQEILENGWDGSSFERLILSFLHIGEMLDVHTQRHFAFPVIHYFHNGERRTAIAPAIIALHEAVTVLTEQVAPQARIPEMSIAPVRDGLSDIVRVLESHYPQDPAAVLPRLEVCIGDCGIPSVAGGTALLSDKAAGSRRILESFLNDSGWRSTDDR